MVQRRNVGFTPTKSFRWIALSKPVLAVFVVWTLFTNAIVGTQAAGFLPGGSFISGLISSLAQNNQEGDEDLESNTTVDADIETDASNDIDVLQNDDGSSSSGNNQDAETDPEAIAGADVSGDIAAENSGTVDQTYGDGQSNQEGDLDGTADTEATIGVDVGALNTVGIVQDIDNGAQTNQDADDHALANAGLISSMLARALNLLGITQESGSGQANQTGEMDVDADTDATQDLHSGAANTTGILQSTGGPNYYSNYNQNIFNTTIANTFIDASQIVTAINDIDVTMVAGDGLNNQNVFLDIDADADGNQIVSGDAVNTNFLTQYAGGGGDVNANQMAMNEALANTQVGAEQDNLAINNGDVFQEAGDGKNNQDNDIDADADADADQGVSGLAANLTTIIQDVGDKDGNVNQMANALSTAVTGVGAQQTNLGANIFNVAQVAGAGLNNQNNDIDLDADADGEQTVAGVASNTTIIAQDPNGNVNQNADSVSVAATEVGAGQINTGLNTLVITQDAEGEKNNQMNDVDLDADADGDQTVSGVASNFTSISQDASGEGNVNQAAGDPSSTASTGVAAAQVNSAINDATISQVAGDGLNNQMNDLDVDADADADQTVTGTSGNTTIVAQNVDDADGNVNQSADSVSVAATGVEALQQNTALNWVGIAQEAGEGEGNQMNELDLDADADADQTAVGTSANVTTIAQDAKGDGNVNQMATTNSVASTGVEALQSNNGSNTVAIAQELADGLNNQSNELDLDADADADQTAVGTSSNTTVIAQDPEGQANQNADSVSVAATGVGALQQNSALNAVEIAQVAGEGKANQMNDLDLDADADADQTVVGTSANTTVISQLADGEGNINQGAGDPSSTAVTSVLGLQNNAAINAVGIAQTAGDEGLNNQMNELDLDADADADQTVVGTSANTTVVAQEATDVDGNVNQNADSVSVAGTEAAGAQQNLASNLVGIGQLAGDGENNQMNELDLDADADADQTVVGTSANTTVITQDAKGDGNINQMANALSVGSTDVAAQQENGAINLVELGQLAADGLNNQSNDLDLDADADADQTVVGATTNTTVIAQDPTGNTNQNADSVSVAGTDVGALQSNTALNAVEIAQEAGEGKNNQMNELDLDADADADQTVVGTSGNTTVIEQDAEGDGNINQAAGDPTSVAGTTVGALQENLASNAVGIGQSAADGLNNQSNDLDLDADADADQTVVGTSGNTTIVSQDADFDGNLNQMADSVSEAHTTVGAAQENGALNLVGIGQTGGEGKNNQMNDVDLDADADADQTVLGTAINSTTLVQDATGDGNVNQMANANSDAEANVGALQENTSLNALGIAQTADDGQTNQMNDIDLDADSDADQTVLGHASNWTIIAQDPTGSTNQNAVSDSDADTAVGAAQINAAGNLVGVTQDSSDGQSNQSTDIDVDADADANQTVEGESINDTIITQEADGDGKANQMATAGSTATTAVGALQENGAANVIAVAQDPVDQANQSVEIDAEADADAEQHVDGSSSNVTLIDQVAKGDGLVNQNALATSDATTAVGAEQANSALNEIGVDQACDGLACAQGVDISPDADADATQGVNGSSDNTTIISQDPDGSANQDAAASSTANTEVGAGQWNSALNKVGVIQVCTGVVCAQYQEVKPKATADAGQTVTGTSGNTTQIDQDATGDGKSNQNADIDSDAGTEVGAVQDNEAANEIDLLQECTGKVCAQYAEVAPEADADASQNVTGDASNTNNVTQTADGDGLANQMADSEATADTEVGAVQVNKALNTINVIQNCGSLVCAQGAGIKPKANATAAQETTGTSSNGTTITQDPTGSANQMAESDSTANTGVGAVQENEANNLINLTQTCAGPVCAAGAEIDPTATANATQTVTGDSSNNTTIDQTAGDDDSVNQAADADSTANTDIDASQTNTANNTVTVDQTGGGTQSGNQSAKVGGSATATTTSTITGGSSNNTTIIQK
jgi:hypothetical protein